jgi:hypothetical protein
MMRWLVNLLAVCCLAAGVAWFVAYDNAKAQHERAVVETTRAVRLVEQMIKFKSTQPEMDLNEQGFPMTVSKDWFEQSVPFNSMAPSNCPWVEIAGPAEATLSQPRVRQVTDSSVAGLWYNPYRGIVRARVPVQVSDAATTELYNRVNGTSLRTIFDSEKTGTRETIANGEK